MTKSLLAICNAIGLALCAYASLTYAQWVYVFAKAALRDEHPVDWGFAFLISIILLVMGCFLIGISNIIATKAKAGPIRFPSPRLTKISAMLFLAIFLIALTIQAIINPALFKF